MFHTVLNSHVSIGLKLEWSWTGYIFVWATVFLNLIFVYFFYFFKFSSEGGAAPSALTADIDIDEAGATWGEEDIILDEGDYSYSDIDCEI